MPCRAGEKGSSKRSNTPLRVHTVQYILVAIHPSYSHHHHHHHHLSHRLFVPTAPMPRLKWWRIWSLYHEDPLLPRLFRAGRDVRRARNELRWLHEHALSLSRQRRLKGLTGWRTLLRRLCILRSQGRPLQYIIGNQPFGDLDILCRLGVLIPR